MLCRQADEFKEQHSSFGQIKSPTQLFGSRTSLQDAELPTPGRLSVRTAALVIWVFVQAERGLLRQHHMPAMSAGVPMVSPSPRIMQRNSLSPVPTRLLLFSFRSQITIVDVVLGDRANRPRRHQAE